MDFYRILAMIAELAAKAGAGTVQPQTADPL